MSAPNLLIPVRHYEKQRGLFRWPDGPVLATPRAADVLPLRQLAEDLNRTCRIRARIVRDAFGPAVLRVRREPNIANIEAYRLTVSPDGIEIAAGGDPGAYYAVQTLRELLAAEGRSLSCCAIDDSPDFPRRGVYVDCSRGKVPKVETLKALVERMARWKANELQLYIENVFAFKRHPDIGRGYSPFTPAEILEIQDHCKRHHVNFVGSLASFGHLEKILCLPRYRHLGEAPGSRENPGGTTLYPGDPRSIRFMAELYEEFAPLFEAKDFNACCDETCELGKGRSRERAERIGVGRVYLDFVKKLLDVNRAHGKRMNIWADIVLEHPDLLGEAPRDIVMLNWDYNADGARIGRTKEIAGTGLPFMVCPGTSSWQTHGTRLANAIGNVARFAAEGRRYGAEGLLNTDWGDCGHRNFLGVSLHSFAHGAAHSWNGRGVNDRKFTETFCFHAFGMGKRLSDSVQLLGGSYRTCGAPYGNECALYHALVEPLASPKDAPHSRIEKSSADGLRKIASALGHAGIWPDPPTAMDRFEALALREMTLAARMDVLACRRALTAKAIRAGKSVPASELRDLAGGMRCLATDFSKLWLARNKPSRLRDNLAQFGKAERESNRLSHR